ncbi:MAG: hypothetical protein IJ955_04725, partial [Oscillospiraceae bacterium]|nr:hypothetical protein [Oscillospiraceae bacterium]
MKTTRTEKLADHLTELDGDLLSTAYEIDDAEKLKQYTRPKYQIKPHLVRKLTAIAACLTLIIATAFTLPAVLPEKQTQPSGTTSTTATSDANIILPPVRVGTQGTLKLMYSDE